MSKDLCLCSSLVKKDMRIGKARAQALKGVNEEGKPDVTIKSESKESVDTKDASGILCLNDGENNVFYARSSSDSTKVDDVFVVKSENRELMGAEDMSGLICANNCQDRVF
ncbi:hypothetical protein MUK42_16382 [Musa troglodytarum]|uniref:Uncharacterized protein n=1 Tax=Musa troglodytarum TaxID=320322 RepID=A0A9E7HPD9_9LILI|nr:hypothetical protein MUK42_16382 [Musa troglodytarum]